MRLIRVNKRHLVPAPYADLTEVNVVGPRLRLEPAGILIVGGCASTLPGAANDCWNAIQVGGIPLSMGHARDPSRGLRRTDGRPGRCSPGGTVMDDASPRSAAKTPAPKPTTPTRFGGVCLRGLPQRRRPFDAVALAVQTHEAARLTPQPIGDQTHETARALRRRAIVTGRPRTFRIWPVVS
jgi:hypothetical protein